MSKYLRNLQDNNVYMKEKMRITSTRRKIK